MFRKKMSLLQSTQTSVHYNKINFKTYLKFFSLTFKYSERNGGCKEPNMAKVITSTLDSVSDNTFGMCGFYFRQSTKIKKININATHRIFTKKLLEINSKYILFKTEYKQALKNCFETTIDEWKIVD